MQNQRLLNERHNDFFLKRPEYYYYYININCGTCDVIDVLINFIFKDFFINFIFLKPLKTRGDQITLSK